MLHINIVGVVTCSDNSTCRLVTCSLSLDLFFKIHFIITLHSSIAAMSASQYKKKKLKLNKMLSILVMCCNFMSCIFMSWNFMPCNFDGPSFSCPSFSVPPNHITMIDGCILGVLCVFCQPNYATTQFCAILRIRDLEALD